MMRAGAAASAVIAHQRAAPWLAVLLGLLAFGISYRWRILDPGYIDWLLAGDPAQHYLGWAFFRQSAWAWPLGSVNGFGYPFETTVAFTDSIPLLAIPLKLLSPWLGADFQYFGLWIALCHGLSALLGWRLLRESGVAGTAALPGSVLFALAPCLLMRAYGHESLMAQWLILWALLLYIRVALGRLHGTAFSLHGAALLGIAAWVHPYLLLMSLLLFGAALTQALRQQPGGWRTLLPGALAVLALVLLMLAAAGFFHGQGKSYGASGYPNYSANLLTWLDPMDWHEFLRAYQRDSAGKAQWSRLLPGLGHADRDQYEGFAYLGLGVLGLLIFALARRAPMTGRGRWWPLLGVLLALALFSLSTKPTLGRWVLFDLPLTPALHDALSVFRASGRFIWPATYALLTLAVVWACRGLSPGRQCVLLAAALALQLWDLSPKLGELRSLRGSRVAYAMPLRAPVWSAPDAAVRRWLVLDETTHNDDWVAFGLLAARQQRATTAGLLSRVDEAARAAWLKDAAERVSRAELRADEAYVSRTELLAADRIPPGWHAERADGWWVLLPRRRP